MKRVVKFLVLMLFVITTIMCTGCNVNNNVKMTEEGKGTQVVKIGIDKSIFKEEYVKVSNIEEMANLIRGKISDNRITITTDTTSKSTKDYIVASFKYDSVEEMDALVKKLAKEMDDMDLSKEEILDDVKDEKGEELYVTALKEYMDTNGITYTPNSEGFNKLVVAFEKAMEFDSDVDFDELSNEFDELDKSLGFSDDLEDDNLSSEEFLKTMIIKGTNSSQLKIGVETIYTFPAYIVFILADNIDSIYDSDKMVDDVVNDFVLEEKKDYIEMFNKVDLATRIKNNLEQGQSNGAEDVEKIDNTDDANNEENTVNIDNTNSKENTEVITPIYNVDIITDEQLASIFDKNMVTEMDKAYYDEDDYSDEDDMDLDFDIAGALENMEDIFTTIIEYGNQVVKLRLDDLLENADEDGYITIDSVKGLINSNSKNLNKAGDMDDTPKTGDKINVLLFGMIALIAALISIGSIYIYKKNK